MRSGPKNALMVSNSAAAGEIDDEQVETELCKLGGTSEKLPEQRQKVRGEQKLDGIPELIALLGRRGRRSWRREACA